MGTSRRGNRKAYAALACVVLGLGAFGAACVPEAPAPGCPTGPPDAITSTIYNGVNGVRRANGLGGLGWNARLACLATEWSGVMAGQGRLAHRDLQATIYSPGFETYTGLAENVYVGPGGSSGDMIHNAWVNSPGHYGNIVGPYDAFGAGYARGADGRLWATENFGRH